MKIVLDTNALVSGLLSPFRPPGEIVRMTSSGTLELCYDARILSEYEHVLSRPKFRFDAHHVDALIDQIKACGHSVASQPLVQPLPDPGDGPFLEVAIAGQVECLVTGNVKHFPATAREKIEIVTPSDFLKLYRHRSQ